DSPTPNFLQLAALVVPQRRLGLRSSLGRACAFLPMPLCLGWDTDPTGDDSPPDILVPGLLLSDIASGATRMVEAPWMHALYKHGRETYSPGTVVVNLREAGYTSRLGIPHIAMLTTLIAQIIVIVTFMAYGNTREGALLLAASAIRILEGVTSDTKAAVFCATHRNDDETYSGYRPQILWSGAVRQFGRRRRAMANGTDESVGVLVPKRNQTVRLASKGVASELAATWGDVLPSRDSIVLDTSDSILDRVAAACQFANSVSIGFIESILPDSEGLHAYYQWILMALDPGSQLVRPKHAEGDTVLHSTLRRRHGSSRDSVQREGP
ncbi:hypothetical protein C8J57DRAFT_1601727, partial [Mycena rebaudengoi]